MILRHVCVMFATGDVGIAIHNHAPADTERWAFVSLGWSLPKWRQS